MHKLKDDSQPEADIYKDRYNHEENGISYDIRVVTKDEIQTLEVRKFNPQSESYESVDISETREREWLDQIAICNLTKHGHMPNPSDVNFKMALKVLRAGDSTPEALQAKIDALEAENAKNRALLKEKIQ